MKEKSNILVLTSTFPRWQDDTVPSFVFQLCRNLKSFKICVVAPHEQGAKYAESVEGIQVRRFSYFFSKWQSLAYGGGILNNIKENPWRIGLVPLFMLAELFAVVRQLRTGKYDVIHAHWLVPQGLVAVVARFVGNRSSVPILVTCHGGDLYALKGRMFEKLKRYVLSKVDGIAVVSHAMKKTIADMGIAPSKIQVIPMGVYLEKMFVPPRKRRNKKQLLFVGRLVEKKGVQYLIEALSRVVQIHPDVKLLVAGGGTDETQLRNLVDDLRLQNNVIFLGAVEHNILPALYQASEVVVFPSIIASDGDQEGFGLVQVEALGCECGVISSDLPAIRDIITDGKTGLIVPQKNYKALSQKIIHLLENPRIREALGREGRAFVLERYDWDIIAGKYTALIENMIQQALSITSSKISKYPKT